VSHQVLADSDIAWLLAVPKYITDLSWRTKLLPPALGPLDRRGRLDLGDLPPGGPVGGTLLLYARENLRVGVDGDWSVGLAYTDYAGRSYRVLRCNGPHPTEHTNVIEGEHIVRTPHIHRLTERYQRLTPPRPDGYAMPSTEYSTPAEALTHIVGLVNLQPSGILFL
jgi:hypothetical protein